MTNDVFTLDENNNAAIRTLGVNPGSAETNSPSVFTEDENGNTCIRVTGSGGSVDESKVIVLSDTIPTADADSLGKFYCYKGTTNASYTHGYVYECVEGSAYYVANIAFEQSTFASESFEKAGQLIVDAGVSDPTEVTGGTMTYALAGNLWSIVFTDENGNDLNTPYSIYTDDLEQDYDILPVIDPSDFVDGQVVSMIINNVSEEQGYVWERIDLQPAAKLGRYLAGWNCATGLAMTNPPESPYEYTTGDYFIVGVVATGGASNYKPNGSSYTTGVASSTVESESVSVNDMYLYDGTNWTLLKTGSTVTSVNGQTGDVTVQETLVSGTNIKTINGNSVLGSGNMQISGFLPFPAGWTTNGTTKALCDDIAADTITVKGSAFLGEVTCSDLPAGISNSEINVYINDGTTAANKVIILELTSGNVAPYRWIYVYWNGGTDTSGWKTWQETLVSGTNIKTINNTSILGSGNITTEAIQVSTMPTAGVDELGKVYQFIGTTDANYTHGYFYECVSDGQNPATYSWSNIQVQMSSGGLPSQTGNSGKFLVTDGTNASWSDTVNHIKMVKATDFAALDITNGSFVFPTIFQLYCWDVSNAKPKIQFYWKDNTLSSSISFKEKNILPSSGIMLGSASNIFANVYTNKINNGVDITVPTIGGTLALQIATMPTAGSTYEGTIYQFTGTTDSTYTNGHFYKCVSDGGNPATYSWEEVQLGGGGGSTGTTASLVVADWSSNTQTVNVTGVTASNNVIVAPAPLSAEDYADAGVLCTNQGAGTLTFTCKTTPTNDITVNIIIM